MEDSPTSSDWTSTTVCPSDSRSDSVPGVGSRFGLPPRMPGSWQSTSSQHPGVDFARDLQDIRDNMQAAERRLEERCEQMHAASAMTVASLLERMTACEINILCAWDKQSQEIESIRHSQARVEQELKALECRPGTAAVRGSLAEQSHVSKRSRDVQSLAGSSSRTSNNWLEPWRTVEEALYTLGEQTQALQLGRDSLAALLHSSRTPGHVNSPPRYETDNLDRGIRGSIASRERATVEQFVSSEGSNAMLRELLSNLECTLQQNKSLLGGRLQHLQDAIAQHTQDLYGLQRAVKDLDVTTDKHARAHQDQRFMIDNLQDAVRDLFHSLEKNDRTSAGT